MVITLQRRNTITIPQELRKQLDLEPGDPLEVEVEGGQLVIRPVAVVPRTLRLTAEGAQKEAEADEEIRRGQMEEFDSAGELLAELEG